MRYLAIARYRFLTSIRAANWLFGVAMLAAILCFMTTGVPLQSEFSRWRHADAILRTSATMLIVSYFVHISILLSACSAFGAVRRGADEGEKADLLDTAPLLPGHRFIGDALGIFGAVIALHLCVLPIIALTAAVGPLSTSFVVYAELLVVATAAFFSTGASWLLRARNSRWQQTRAMRSMAAFLICFLLIFVVNAKWPDILNALIWTVGEPSRRQFANLAAQVENPVAMMLSLVVLYLGFLSFFYLHAVRQQQSRREQS